MDFNLTIQAKVKKIEDIIKEHLPMEKGKQKLVIEASNYSILAGGKRIRPMLMMESFVLFKGENEELLQPFLAAIEMIHNYSLVHDDLPAMDNDDLRRGRPTTHIEFGEDMAILAGDSLLNLAFETSIKAFQNINVGSSDELIKYKRVSKALEVLAHKSGIYGMIGGQAVDIQEERAGDEFENLDFIYRLKTSALIEASMVIGAIIAGASDVEITKIDKIASNLGIAFQIKDDILDLIGTEEALGKPVKSDVKNNKKTYVDLMGIDKAEEKVEQYSRQAIEIYESIGYENDYLKTLIIKLINRES